MGEDREPQLDVLQDRRITIGVTGGIAAYKIPGLVSLLRARGADVRLVMTEAAGWFVTETVLATISGHEVYSKMFGVPLGDALHHIRLQEFGEAFLVAPATADILAKAAHGIADDLLSTSLVAARCPLVFAPAMNDVMWCNGIVQENVATLKRHGALFVMPEAGRLACGVEGTGRMAAEDLLVAALEDALVFGTAGPDLSGAKLVVSAGPTREALDPVRFLSNRSTGKMGFALARMAERCGAEVTLVAGPTDLAAPAGVQVINVASCAEMNEAVLEAVRGAQAFISAAAPADYRPAAFSPTKIKKGADLSLALERTPDILLNVGQTCRPPVLVGFAAETGDAVNTAREKLVRKDLDLLAVNDVLEPGSGFAADTNRIVILRRDGTETALPLMSKLAVARALLTEIAALLQRA